MPISFLRARIIAYDWDDPEEIYEKLKSLLSGLDLKKEKIEIKKSRGTGLISTELDVFEVELKKRRHIKTFLRNLFSGLTEEEIDKILSQANLDENYSVYLRFDKTDLLVKDKKTIVQHGDVLHVKISFDMHGKSKEKVLNELKKEILEALKE